VQSKVSDPAEIIRIAPAGDEALVVEFVPVISREVNRHVRTLFRALLKADLAEIKGLVPSYRSLLVYYDSAAISFDHLVERILEVHRLAVNTNSSARRWRLPVCYGLDCRDDLNDLADRLEMPVDSVVRAHSDPTYMVYMIGFSPGFAYLGELRPELEIPRKTIPAALVPANAIQIGGRQTAVSSMPMPSGWYVVGRCPVPMFDPSRERPFLLEGGDLVSFESITEADFDRLAELSARNAFAPHREFTS
jgi:KipI family sensor histidine kinase inhibitor